MERRSGEGGEGWRTRVGDFQGNKTKRQRYKAASRGKTGLRSKAGLCCAVIGSARMPLTAAVCGK